MLKVRCTSTLVSALLLSLCLSALIPAALRNILTWKQPYLDMGSGVRVENFLMPFGFFHLGIVIIGLIVLWTGYRRTERWAWFVMLVVLLCFFFPSSVLPVLLQIRAQDYRWSMLLDLLRASPAGGLWHCLAIAPACCDYAVGVDCMAVLMLIGILNFVVMVVALLLPIKEFFWNTAQD